MRYPWICLSAVAIAVVGADALRAATVASQVNIASISPCPSFCGGTGGQSEFASNGGAGATSAYSTLTNAMGTAQGEAGLEGAQLLPILRAEAYSNPNARISAIATGMQKFVYTGPGTSGLTLDLQLDGEATATSPLDALVQASVIVVRGSDMEFYMDFGTMAFEVIPGDPSLESLGEIQLSIPVNAGQQGITGNIPFDLADGEEFLVWANLNTRGTRGGHGDAFNTLSASFSDPTGIEAVGIPEPATLVLLLGGLATIALRHRSW